MHELSIALSIVERVEEEVRRQGDARVCAVHLRLGSLSGVVREALCFSYEVACQGTVLEGSQLIVREVPIRLWCDECGGESGPVSNQCLHCAKCGSPACRVTGGDEMELESIEVEDVEHVTAAIG